MMRVPGLVNLIHAMPSAGIGAVDVRFRAQGLTDSSRLIGAVTHS
jgi:hypothetical protein